MDQTQTQTMTEAEADEQPVFIPCGRCGGQGGLACFAHVYDGVCFECDGRRGRWSTVGNERRAEQRRIKNAERSARRAEAKAAARREARDAFLAQHDGLAAALDLDHAITADLATSLLHFGSLSDKQVALALRIAQEQAEREAERAAQPNEPVPAGRGPVTGEVVTLRADESPFDGSIVLKMLVADDRGFRVWGTVPRSLRDAEVSKGQRVTFTATLAAKEDGFGFFSRPSKASILD